MTNLELTGHCRLWPTIDTLRCSFTRSALQAQRSIFSAETSVSGRSGSSRHCENTASFARCAVRVAPDLRSDGRNPDRSQMRGFPAKPRLDGSTGSGPRGDGVGAVSAVAHQKLMAAAVYGVLVGGTVDPQSRERSKSDGNTTSRSMGMTICCSEGWRLRFPTKRMTDDHFQSLDVAELKAAMRFSYRLPLRRLHHLPLLRHPCPDPRRCPTLRLQQAH